MKVVGIKALMTDQDVIRNHCGVLFIHKRECDKSVSGDTVKEQISQVLTVPRVDQEPGNVYFHMTIPKWYVRKS